MCEHEGMECPGRSCRCECMNCMLPDEDTGDEVDIWYLYDWNTHGETGLYLVSRMSELDLAEEQKGWPPSVGPDVILEGTARRSSNA